MKQDTFDIPAYKFAIKKTYGDNEFYIPFDNFDGLTLDEVYDIIYCKRKRVSTIYDINIYEHPIRFVCYIGGGEHLNIDEIFSIIYYPNEIRKSKDGFIDKLLEEKLSELYNEFTNLKVKKGINCFFERYMDNTHQEILSRIKKLSK